MDGNFIGDLDLSIRDNDFWRRDMDNEIDRFLFLFSTNRLEVEFWSGNDFFSTNIYFCLVKFKFLKKFTFVSLSMHFWKIWFFGLKCRIFFIIVICQGSQDNVVLHVQYLVLLCVLSDMSTKIFQVDYFSMKHVKWRKKMLRIKQKFIVLKIRTSQVIKSYLKKKVW